MNPLTSFIIIILFLTPLVSTQTLLIYIPKQLKKYIFHFIYSQKFLIGILIENLYQSESSAYLNVPFSLHI